MYVAKTRRIPSWKLEEVEELTKLFREHKVFLIADLTGVPANVLQKLRRSLSSIATFRVSKNKLLTIAMKKAGIETSILEKYLTGQNIIIFSKSNAFEINYMLEKNAIKTYYKPGDVAESEVVVPEGNTGIPPGPMLSLFGKLKIPTKVEGNTIVVVKDTVVAKPGDKISDELASLLQKLNLPLKTIKLKIKVAYDNGVLITGEKLKLDIDSYINDIKRAFLEARSLAVEIVLPEPDIIELAISKAYREALALAIESVFIAPDTLEQIIKSAYMRAYALAVELVKQGVQLDIAIPQQQVTQQPVESKPKEEEKEEKEETLSEETLAEGLGSLF
ncbi:MAG: 50S ribosomal protein L10 [Desulfurococcaceae archaeon]